MEYDGDDDERVIETHDDRDACGAHHELDRRAILEPAIHEVIAALGGREGDAYVLGDECYGCLKDLKKFWHKDDTDDERTVARIFWEARVLPNDLVPILMETAGKGFVSHKCAIACADIITSMTWPIDLAEELKELDEELDKGTDYTQLLQSHLHYKAALLKPGVLEAFLGILLPLLAKDKKERTERDGQVINVILHLFRNLVFIKDRPPNMHASSDHAELSSLQSKLIKVYSESHILDLLVTIASNASDPFFNQWNTLVLETFYLLFRNVSSSTLAFDQRKKSQMALSKLLEAENKVKIENTRRASTRHSRFGTTITITLNPSKTANKDISEAEGAGTSAGSANAGPSQSFVLHRQQALRKDAGDILDMRKKRQFRKVNKVDELGLQENLDQDARNLMQNLARTFIRSCFNTFLASILKDIKSERPKITEKDNLRLLFVAKWFLEFFHAVRAKQLEESLDKVNANKTDADSTPWRFELVGEVVERSWIIWILKRMRQAFEDKPKSWTELQAGIECLTQLLTLIDIMHTSSKEIADDSDLAEAAALLKQQIVYNGEVLDISVDSLREYKEGVQSLKYLDASIRLGYTLLRILEKWGRERGGGELYVRKKKVRKSKKSKGSKLIDCKDGEGEEEEEIAEYGEENSEDEYVTREIVFTFETFEMKFANEDITHTLLAYLARYDEFTSSDQMKCVVSLMHRQVVRAKAEGLYFKVSSLHLFRSILARQSSLSTEQPYKDLIALINFILRKFFKAVNEEPLLIVEAFFPKNRSRWKQYSSWQPGPKNIGGVDSSDNEDERPAEVKVKKGHSWSEQLGIAIAYLVENGQRKWIDWVREILPTVIRQRERIVEEVDGSMSNNLDGADVTGDDEIWESRGKLQQPSNEAVAKFEDYIIPCVNDEQANAATKNVHLKLVFRLLKFAIIDENADELEWYVPASVLPAELQRCLNVINQFLEKPIDLGGKKAAQLISKKSRRRRRRRRHHDRHGDDGELDNGDGVGDYDGETDPHRRQHERRRRSTGRKDASNSDESEDDDSTDGAPRRKRARKKKEEETYKSAQFIVDSDDERYGLDDAFWEREKALREKMARLGEAGTMDEGGANSRPVNMRAHGTKKRRRRVKSADEDAGGKNNAGEGDSSEDAADGAKKRLKGSPTPDSDTESNERPSGRGSSEDAKEMKMAMAMTKVGPRLKPRPRPRYRGARSEGNEGDIDANNENNGGVGGVKLDASRSAGAVMTGSDVGDEGTTSDGLLSPLVHKANERIKSKTRARIVVSDEEE